MGEWQEHRGALCRGGSPRGAVSRRSGREIVLPSQREVIAPVPGAPGLRLPAQQQEKLITLTTCHPKFSARKRLIIHGALVAQYAKAGAPPSELTIA